MSAVSIAWKADGEVLAFVVVVATGASTRPSPWAVPSGAHVLRTLNDCVALHGDLRAEWPGGGAVVIVGGGFIGAEVAAAARALGHRVSVVDPLPAPIGRAVGPEVGAHLAALHHRHGVATHFGVGVQAVEGSAGDLTVRLTDGAELPATTVVVGIGANPNTGWLAGSGLLLDDGVVCDAQGRAQDTPGVYAVGDVARWLDPDSGEHRRVEHWTSAVDQARCVARTICRPDSPPLRQVDYVWTDQHDCKIQILGRPLLGTRTEVLGRFTDSSAKAAALYADDEGRLVGAVTMNWPKAMVTCRRLIGLRANLSDAQEQIQLPSHCRPT
ncbi:hypothetical protein GCM10009609_26920 [Pseudonocardia aurantiaca]|uniref:NAD(P)/FAD-dependent oxidoreductase n=1 Tax=Pseudonocardia aurantiaca TaxID=75290 RepID=A0ABW4FIC3_9PSEU